MFPIGALLGAFATLGSGLMGASAEKRAADQNYAIDLLNYYQRENERFQTIQESKQNKADTKLGQTDAQGNRVHFVEGVGWVTDLADGQKELQELYQNEERNQLQNDLPKKRGILNANVKRQGMEGSQASGLLDAFQRLRHEDPRQIENLRNQASSKGINEAFDGTLQEAMRTAIRTGASNSGKVAASIGAKRASALSDAFLNNKFGTKAESDARFASDQGNLANIYNMFATRASAMPDVTYNPRNIEGQTAQAAAGSMGSGNAANAALINAFAKQGGSLHSVEPQYGYANTLGQTGSALAGAFDAIATDRERAKVLDSYGSYAGIDPKMYKAGSGLW